MEPSQFLSLLRRARSGDREALALLFDELRSFLEKQARSYSDPTRADESVSDLVQDARLRVWLRLDQFEEAATPEQTQAKFYGWAATVVRTVGLNHKRDGQRKRRRPDTPEQGLPAADSDGRGGPASPDPTASVQLHRREQREQVRQAVESIPEAADREVARLYFLEEVSLLAVAGRLGLTEQQVRRRLRRGKDWLTAVLVELR